MTNCTIRQIFLKPNLSGRLAKWAIELGVYDIKYITRSVKKGQVPADFLVEIQSFEPLEREHDPAKGNDDLGDEHWRSVE